MDKVHEALIDAWVSEAMSLAHECALAFSEMENDSDNDHLSDWNASKRRLREHLARHPGPPPKPEPAHRCPACDSADTSDRHEWMCNECGEYFEVAP
jgi:hypothetical protein